MVHLQLEAWCTIGPSPDTSLDSQDIHQVRITSGTDDAKKLTGFLISWTQEKLGVMPLSRSTSDGYDPLGVEDGDRSRLGCCKDLETGVDNSLVVNKTTRMHDSRCHLQMTDKVAT